MRSPSLSMMLTTLAAKVVQGFFFFVQANYLSSLLAGIRSRLGAIVTLSIVHYPLSIAEWTSALA
jgi:hypothetical protein